MCKQCGLLLLCALALPVTGSLLAMNQDMNQNRFRILPRVDPGEWGVVYHPLNIKPDRQEKEEVEEEGEGSGPQGQATVRMEDLPSFSLCRVCLEEITESSRVVYVLACGHGVIHEACLEKFVYNSEGFPEVFVTPKIMCFCCQQEFQTLSLNKKKFEDFWIDFQIVIDPDAQDRLFHSVCESIKQSPINCNPEATDVEKSTASLAGEYILVGLSRRFSGDIDNIVLNYNERIGEFSRACLRIVNDSLQYPATRIEGLKDNLSVEFEDPVAKIIIAVACKVDETFFQRLCPSTQEQRDYLLKIVQSIRERAMLEFNDAFDHIEKIFGGSRDDHE